MLTAEQIRKKWPVVTEPDSLSLARMAERLGQQGWERRDIVAFIGLTEEASPELDESIALRRMAVLNKKYPGTRT